MNDKSFFSAILQVATELGLIAGPESDSEGEEAEQSKAEEEKSETATALEDIEAALQGLDVAESRLREGRIDQSDCFTQVVRDEDDIKCVNDDISKDLDNTTEKHETRRQGCENGTDKLESDSEDELPELVDLSTQNKEYRPFRSEESKTHVNSHLENVRQRSSDSFSSSTTQSSIDPHVIKMKLKRQQKKTQQKQLARRLRKSGEAAIITKSRREHSDNIKQSLSDVWY